MSAATITGLLKLGGIALDKIFPDKAERAKAEAELLEVAQAGDIAALKAHVDTLTKAADIIISEAKSEHKITATWRPITMLVFVVIIANNYILYPYLSIFWDNAPALTLPPEMWTILKIGLGGYIGGRSIEKTATAIAKTVNKQ